MVTQFLGLFLHPHKKWPTQAVPPETETENEKTFTIPPSQLLSRQCRAKVKQKQLV